MPDAPKKELHLGDKVVVAGITPDDYEFDRGTITRIEPRTGKALVYWEYAEESYIELIDALALEEEKQ